ncbi:MAG TPA: type II toxin-antitoxin system Phd/YefM family antitoxin [Armatimonadota bacterium]|nr:type II toxin-antitoxin system Phd/YefM family antitoxin [Armatimonadota bacterium]
MPDRSNLYSLAEFQRSAKGFITGLNETKEPLLITVDGKVQAVLVDPVSFQEMQAQMERERLIGAILEGEEDIQAGMTRPAAEVFAGLRTKHGF